VEEGLYLEFLAYEAYLAGQEFGQYIRDNWQEWNGELDSWFFNWINSNFSSAGDACYDPTEDFDDSEAPRLPRE